MRASFDTLTDGTQPYAAYPDQVQYTVSSSSAVCYSTTYDWDLTTGAEGPGALFYMGLTYSAQTYGVYLECHQWQMFSSCNIDGAEFSTSAGDFYGCTSN